MSQSLHIAEALRKLVETARSFERKAARHKQIEPQRQALNDAITEAQLLLSLAKPEEPMPSPAMEQQALPMVHGMKGGKPGKVRPRHK